MSEHAPSPRSGTSTRVLVTVSFAVFATSLFYRAVDPVIPQIAADLHETVAAVALLATAFALPYALVQPVLGTLADVLGKTRLMFACLVVVTISTFAGAVAPNLTWLMISRVVSGVVAGGTFLAALALIAQVVPIQHRQVAVSRLLAAGMLGNLMGSAVNGMIADTFGWRGVFVVNGAIALAALIAAFIGFGGPGQRPPQTIDLKAIPASYRAILSHPLAKYCFGGVLMEGIFLIGLFSYVAPLLHASGERRATISGLVIASFGIGGLLYSLIVARALPLLGERRLMLLGGSLLGVGLTAMAFMPPWQIQIAVFTLLGLSFFLLHGVIQITMTELAPSARGSATAIHGTFFFFGQAIGPIYYQLAFAGIGQAATLVISGLALIATAVVCAFGLTQRPR